MQLLLAASAILTTLLVGGWMCYDAFVRGNALLTYRNFFLLGFLFFYGAATSFITLLGKGGGEIYTPEGQGYGVLAVLIPGFAVFYILANHWGSKLKFPSKLVPKLELPVNTPAILTFIGIMLFVAGLGLIAPNSYAGAVLMQMRPGLAAAAVGLATYFVLAQKRNPIAWIIFGGVFIFGSLLSVAGGTDRRFVLGVFIVVVWVWYYYSLRFRSVKSTVAKLVVLGAAGVFFIVLYSGIRHVGRSDLNIGARADQFLTSFQDPTVKKGALESVLYQDAPINTLYIIETYPRDNPLDPFNGLLFYVSNPIPRFLWPEKPVGLGYALQQQFNIAANLGPGIIGHGWAEGMWVGVVGYALVFGLITGVLDRLMRERAENPYYVAVMGSFMGNYLGLSRGETSLFMVLITTGLVGAFAILMVGRVTLSPLFAAFRPLVIPIPGTPSYEQEAWQEGSSDAEPDYVDQDLAAAYGEPQPALDHGEYR